MDPRERLGTMPSNSSPPRGVTSKENQFNGRSAESRAAQVPNCPKLAREELHVTATSADLTKTPGLHVGKPMKEHSEPQKLSPTASSFHPISSLIPQIYHGALGDSYLKAMSSYGIMASQLLSADLGVSRHLLFTSAAAKVTPSDVDTFMEVKPCELDSVISIKRLMLP